MFSSASTHSGMQSDITLVLLEQNRISGAFNRGVYGCIYYYGISDFETCKHLGEPNETI